MMNRWRMGLAGALLGLASFGAGAETAQYLGYAMGTLVQGTMTAKDKTTADELTNRYESLISDYETLFTVHGEGPMQDINRHPGEWQKTDCRVAQLMESAKTIARESEGAFDPTIGPVVNVWKIGFGGDSVPSDAVIDEAKKHVDWRRIETKLAPDEAGRCRVKIGEGQNVDLGAIAKGWIGTAAAKELQKAGAESGILDLGGNIVLMGSGESGRNWRVGVQDPRKDRNEMLAVIETPGNVSVITSGDYERYFMKDGKRYGHILSGATGRPVPLSFSSVTIVDADGAKADGWCTALFAMGKARALTFLARRTDIEAFVLSGDEKEAWVSEALAPRLKLTDETIQLHVIKARKD